MLPVTTTFPIGFLCEEERDGYLVSAQMKKVWAVEIDLLMKLIGVCKKHNIRIYAEGGTVLGATRHHGMIPWDDDIDMIMTRSEYIRLCRIAPKEFNHPYFFQTEETDPGSIRGHAQIRNSETTGILAYEGKGFKFNQGIFIDIFILDNFPDNVQHRITYCNEISKLSREILRRRERGRYRNCGNSVWSGTKYTLRKLLYGTIFKKEANYTKCYIQREQLFQKYNECQTTKYVETPFSREQYTYDKKIYDDVVWLDFEWFKIPVPIGYEQYLDKTYGDWHSFEIGKNAHGEVFFDPEKSYKMYV